MAAEVQIIENFGPVFKGPNVGVVASSTVIKKGQALWWNGTQWALADASDHLKPCHGFALNDVDSLQELTKRVGVARHVLIDDLDAPYTAGDTLWLSETAGLLTHTRPTTAATLRQPLGEAMTTEQAELVVRANSFVYAPIHMGPTNQAEDALALDSGNYIGKQLDAQNEFQGAIAILPKNFLRVEEAILYIATEATSGTPTLTITVSSTVSGAQHDVVSQDATLSAQTFEGSAADEIIELDIITGLDGTDITRPGAILGMKLLKADGGTDIGFIYGGYILCEVAA